MVSSLLIQNHVLFIQRSLSASYILGHCTRNGVVFLRTPIDDFVKFPHTILIYTLFTVSAAEMAFATYPGTYRRTYVTQITVPNVT